MIVLNNSPQPGYIEWRDVHIVYKGVDYAIQDGYTNKKYVWWDYDYPTVFQTSDTYPTGLTDDDVIVFLNKNGIHITVPNTTVIDGSLIVPESILADAIAANTITGDKLVAGAISAREIAADAVGAAAIAAGAVLAEHIAADQIQSVHIAAGAVQAEHIAANAILSNHIAAGQILGQHIVAGAITTSHIATAGLDASVIKTGTMLFNRVRGGTAELGGSGNGSGILIVRDASGVEKARIDNTGVSVFDANFLLKDVRTQVPSAVSHVHNMIRDHSFEEVMPTGSVDQYQTFAVRHAGGWSVGTAPARILSTYNTDLPKYALFDYQAAVIRHYNQVLWRQYTELDYSVGLAGPYTVSAWFAAFDATTRDTTAKIELWACDYNWRRIQQVAVATVQIKANEKWVWKRTYATASNLPSNTWYLEVAISCDPDTWILCDGVQLVPLPYPAVYNPESGVWRVSRAVYEGFSYVPPSIRITRTSNRAVPNSTPTPIPWQARYPGYNPGGMWEPSQSDTTQIFIPQSGKYLIICTVRWAANPNGYRMLAIKVNNGNNIAKVQEQAVASNNPTYQQISAMAHLNAGDYFQVLAVQNSGTTLNLEIEAETAPVLQVIELV